jgi:hypothetical protein
MGSCRRSRLVAGVKFAIAAVVLSVTLPFLPWGKWVEHRLGFDAATNLTWNGSAWRFPPLVPFAVAALVVLRHRGAEWLAIPAVWPGTQLFYHVFALPTVRDKPWLAALLALPMPLLAPCAVIAYAVLWRRPPPAPAAGAPPGIQTSP